MQAFRLSPWALLQPPQAAARPRHPLRQARQHLPSQPRPGRRHHLAVM